MEILRAVVSEEEDAEVTIHGNLLDVLAAMVTVIQGVHEAYRRENPVKAGLFRKLLTSYLNEEAEDAFAPIEDEDLGHYADMSALGRLVQAKRQAEADDKERMESDGNEDHEGYSEP